MLDSCVQTASYKPSFPIQCNEKFLFFKTFYSKHQLQALQKQLRKISMIKLNQIFLDVISDDQWLYMELVQWQSCEVGNVLAIFQTTLDELLYPSSFGGSITGVDIDLLMEPSKIFPVSLKICSVFCLSFYYIASTDCFFFSFFQCILSFIFFFYVLFCLKISITNYFHS